MKYLTSLLAVFALVTVVSCGGKDGKSKNDSVSNNLMQPSTIEAYYTPTKQNQIWYGNQWYTLSPSPYGGSQQGYTEFQQVYQTTSQALMSGSSQYTLALVNNVPVFRVRVIGAIGGVNVQGQYPQQQYQYPQQQQATSANTFYFTSIKLY